MVSTKAGGYNNPCQNFIQFFFLLFSQFSLFVFFSQGDARCVQLDWNNVGERRQFVAAVQLFVDKHLPELENKVFVKRVYNAPDALKSLLTEVGLLSISSGSVCLYVLPTNTTSNN